MLRQTLCVLLILSSGSVVHAQAKRKVIIDEDCSGPGGTNMQALLTLINSPDTEVLGITIPTGDAWRDEEVAHTLRLLEIIGRTDIPVVPGAVFPMVNSKQFTAKWEAEFGKVVYQGAWNFGNPVHGPWEIPPMPEGSPSTKASQEDAATFLVRMVNAHPHEVTIYAGAPLTNLAMAMLLDANLPELSKELIIMGGSINPKTDDPEFKAAPHREFNFWMDPDAAHAVLHGHWPRIVLTTVDISITTRMDKNLIARIANGTTPAALYVAKYASAGYLWDELAAAAWLDPAIITKWQKLYIDVNTNFDAAWGNTLSWPPGKQPGKGEPLVDVQQTVDLEKFYKLFVDLITSPTPRKKQRSAEVSIGEKTIFFKQCYK